MSTDKKLDTIINKLDLLINNDVEELEKESSIYNANGVSNEVTYHGGVSIEAVEKAKKEFSRLSKEHKLIADATPKFYCFLQPDLRYTDHQYNQIITNQTQNWISPHKLNEYILYKPRYVHKDTGEGLFRSLTQSERFSKNWDKQQRRQISIIDGHVCVSAGNYSNPDHPDWSTELLEMIPIWVKEKMEGDLKTLRSNSPY